MPRSLLAAMTAACLCGVTSGAARAQETVAQPAYAAQEQASTSTSPAEQGREPSYEAHAVVPGPGPRESDRIGSYAQPRWTAHRRFPTTRIYVRPEGEIALEWWLETKLDLSDTKNVRFRSQYELEFGLGYRLQLDLYLQTEQADWGAPLELESEKVELRWALARWGAIPLNPALYVEFVRQHEAPPKLEFKILLGEELAPRWHLGINLVFEHELGDEQEQEYAITAGIGYSVIDDVLSIGLEVKGEMVDVEGARFAFDNYELLAGPSIAWTPTPPMHVLFVGLFGAETEEEMGVSDTTPLFEPTIVVGWEL